VATPPAACIRFSYGDNAQYAQAHGGGGGVANTDVQVRTSFNFLYFDTATNHWVAVSQPLETQPTTAQPVKGWFESSEAFAERQKSFRRKGTQVAMPPARAPWREMIPY
ncbi:MAG: hypothetical protein RL748_2199, partial [Pseudomonadota bacterium]